LLTLNTGLRIRLLGIRRNEDKALEAMEFLRRMLEGQLVFMKHDKVKTDHLGTELVYLYLENGSFLNALLVKYDLVDVEDTIPFKYKERFQKRQADNRAPK